MKLGLIEVSGITRIVENHKVVWNRYRNRWVKYIGDEIKGGMSMEPMHERLDNIVYNPNTYHIWVNRETINFCKLRKR
jgi:hypothetical protein